MKCFIGYSSNEPVLLSRPALLTKSKQYVGLMIAWPVSNCTFSVMETVSITVSAEVKSDDSDGPTVNNIQIIHIKITDIVFIIIRCIL